MMMGNVLENGKEFDSTAVMCGILLCVFASRFHMFVWPLQRAPATTWIRNPLIGSGQESSHWLRRAAEVGE